MADINIKKWLASATICAVTVCAGLGFAPESAEASNSQVAQAVANEVKYMNLSSPAQVVDEEIYLPLRATFSDMFMALDWCVDGGNVVRVTNSYESYDLYLGEGKQSLKLQEWGPGYAIQSINGASYVPLRFFEDIIANYHIGMSGDQLLILMANGAEIPSFWKNMNASPISVEEIQEAAPVPSIDPSVEEKVIEAPQEAPVVKVAGTGQWAYPTVTHALLTSPFGLRPCPWGSGNSDNHFGIDLAAAQGSPVFSAEAGSVVRAEWFDSYGLCIDVQHADGMMSRYAHLDSIQVAVGQQVVRGQQIGRIGATGAATGPHLHFEVLVDGVRVDGANYIQA